jgi:hypothetical protein
VVGTCSLRLSAKFSSLEIKGNEEVDLTIGVMDPAGAGAGAVPRTRALTDLTFPCNSVDFFLFG